MSRRNVTRGFTLVELLVVMAIIGILTAVSFPAFRSALIHANISKCSSNLRSIGNGLILFAGDNNGCLPESGVSPHYGSADAAPPTGSGQFGWTQQLEPYLGAGSAAENANGNSVYQCPDRALIPNNKYYSYFNGAHAAFAESGGFAAVSLIKMHAPSEHIIAGDIAFNTAFTDRDDDDKDDYTQDPSFNGYTSSTGGPSPIIIHGGSVNLVFADGHVENVKSFDNTKMTTVYAGTGYSYLGPP